MKKGNNKDTETKKNAPSSLALRVRSALLLAPVVLGVIYYGGIPYALMMSVAAWIAVGEWARMVMPQDKNSARMARLASFLAALAALGGPLFDNPLTSLAFLVVAAAMLVALSYARSAPSARLLAGGLVYIGFAISVMGWMRGGQSMQGLHYLATLVAVIWASDVTAYISGKTIGGAKLAPKISPNKTWAGFIGSSVGAAAAAAGMTCPALTAWLDVDTLGNMGWIGYAVMGALLGMVGQGGDLIISAFKRRFNVKDTGNIIPGHGGLLDRIDAMLLAAIVYGCIVEVLA